MNLMRPVPHFPLFISLENKLAVLVGGGEISLRRVKTLLLFGCQIKIIAPMILLELEQLSAQQGILLEKKPYQSGDLVGAALAVAATDNRSVNCAVAQEAKERQIPVSVADCAEECSFYFPAVAFDGEIIAGVVGDGHHHHRVAQTADQIRRILK